MVFQSGSFLMGGVLVFSILPRSSIVTTYMGVESILEDNRRETAWDVIYGGVRVFLKL